MCAGKYVMSIHVLKVHAVREEIINQCAIVCLDCLEIHMLNVHVNSTNLNAPAILIVQHR